MRPSQRSASVNEESNDKYKATALTGAIIKVGGVLMIMGSSLFKYKTLYTK